MANDLTLLFFSLPIPVGRSMDESVEIGSETHRIFNGRAIFFSFLFFVKRLLFEKVWCWVWEVDAFSFRLW